MAAIAQAGRQAGELFIPALGKAIKLVEWREDDFYDTVTTGAVNAASTPAAGTSLEFFRDLASKNLQHTNLRTSRRIPAGSEFIMSRIGVVPAQASGNVVYTPADTEKVAYGATLTFKINDRLVSEGPLYKYQSGYGVTGSTTQNNTGLATIGVPSAAAAPNLMVAQPIMDDDDLVATIDFKSADWLTGYAQPTFTAGLPITLSLHGFIKKPQGK